MAIGRGKEAGISYDIYEDDVSFVVSIDGKSILVLKDHIRRAGKTVIVAALNAYWVDQVVALLIADEVMNMVILKERGTVESGC